MFHAPIWSQKLYEIIGVTFLLNCSQEIPTLDQILKNHSETKPKKDLD